MSVSSESTACFCCVLSTVNQLLNNVPPKTKQHVMLHYFSFRINRLEQPEVPAVEAQNKPFDGNDLLNEASGPLVPPAALDQAQFENLNEPGGIGIGNHMLGNGADVPEDERGVNENENRVSIVSGNDSGLGDADYEDEDHDVPETSPLSSAALIPLVALNHSFTRSSINSYPNRIQTLSQQNRRGIATREGGRGDVSC